MRLATSSTLLDALRLEIQRLPTPAVPLAAALVSTIDGMEPELRRWLMHELGRRACCDTVSPAAEAVMRIVEFGRYHAMDFALAELEAQYSLLQVLGQVEHFYAAVDFMGRLIAHCDTHVATTAGTGNPGNEERKP